MSDGAVFFRKSSSSAQTDEPKSMEDYEIKLDSLEGLEVEEIEGI